MTEARSQGCVGEFLEKRGMCRRGRTRQDADWARAGSMASEPANVGAGGVGRAGGGGGASGPSTVVSEETGRAAAAVAASPREGR